MAAFKAVESSEPVVAATTVSHNPCMWACTNPRCTEICPYPSNPMTTSRCIICKMSAVKWQCKFCSSLQPYKSFECKVCHATRNESEILRQQKVEKRQKQEDDLIARREKLHALALQRVAEEMEAEEQQAKREAAERAKKPFSFSWTPRNVPAGGFKWSLKIDTNCSDETDAESSKEPSPVTKLSASKIFSEYSSSGTNSDSKAEAAVPAVNAPPLPSQQKHDPLMKEEKVDEQEYEAQQKAQEELEVEQKSEMSTVHNIINNVHGLQNQINPITNDP